MVVDRAWHNSRNLPEDPEGKGEPVVVRLEPIPSEEEYEPAEDGAPTAARCCSIVAAETGPARD